MSLPARIKALIQRHLPRHSFVRSVGVLAGGTAIAQAIPIAATPILSRLYSPEDFGLVALFTACASVLSTIVTGRYELAITIPESDIDAANVLMLTIKICIAICIFLYIPISLFNQEIVSILKNTQISFWLYFLPIFVVTQSVIITLQLWLNRTGEYKQIAQNRVQVSIYTTVCNIIFGTMKISGGQVLGSVLGALLALIAVCKKVFRKKNILLKSLCSSRQLEMAKKYAHHPKYYLPAQLIGVISIQIPLFIVSTNYSLAAAGFFSLAYKLVTLPTALVGAAIGDVYRQRIAIEYRKGGGFRTVFIKTIMMTAMIALPFTAAVYIFSPLIFSSLLGEKWVVAGEFARILAISAFFQLVFTPVDKGAVLVGAKGYIFFWHVLRFLFFLSLFFLVLYKDIEIETMLWIYVLMNVILYSIDGWIEYVYAK